MRGADLTPMTPAEHTDYIAQLRAMQNMLHAEELRAIAAYDEKMSWKPEGATSMASWLAGMFGDHRDTAREKVRVAQAFAELPALRRKYESGELSWDQVRATTEFATPDTDEHLASEAPKFSAAHLRRMARRFKPIAEQTARDAIRDRELQLWWDLEKNRLRFKGSLPGADGAVFEKVIERLVHIIADTDNAEGRFDIAKARADALVELASVRIGADPDADRATVAVHVDASVLAGTTGMAEVEGNAVALEAARRLTCDSRWYIVVNDKGGLPIGIGRTSRQVPPWLSREVKHRDGGCRFPGCERRGWIHTHHIHHWAKGGPTDLDNLVALCGAHHRLVHEGGWRITGDVNGLLKFHKPGGGWFEQGPQALEPQLKERVEVLMESQAAGGPSP